MENFVVSARKYRPSTFASVVGQQHITTTLRNAIANHHLAHAFLFCGPRGVGKTTCARILAKTINCTNLGPDVEACNACESCLSFNNNASFNVHELDAASNNSVEDIRSLTEQVRYAPQQGKYKIYIIDEVHMLSNTAFNAFLKTLEEPPSYAIFILATTEKHKIIPTILSRCQIFDFNRIQLRDIAGHLQYIADKEGIAAEPEALDLIARKADGGLRDALSIFDLISTFGEGRRITYSSTIDNLHILDYDYYFRITDAMLEENLPQVLLVFDEILRRGFDGHNFIGGLSEHFRNLMVCKDVATLKLLEVSENVQQKYASQAKASSVSFLLSALNIASAADAQYKGSKNQRLLIELALMKMCHIYSALRPADIARQVAPAGEGDEKKKSEPGLIGGLPGDNSAAVAANPSANGNGFAGSNGNANGHTSAPQAVNTVVSPAPVSPPAMPATPKLSAFEGGIAGLRPTVSLGSFVNLKPGQFKAPESKGPESETGTETVQAAPARPRVVRPFAEADFKAVWKEYTERLAAAGNYSDSAMLADRPMRIAGNYEVTVIFNMQLSADQFSRARPELQSFMRDKLENDAIELFAEVSAHAEQPKAVYTTREKFEYLAEKYPLLLELKEKLKLEIES
ncbi:MAG: DNA polymerase III subunit gamma/tau [Bacteroidota bacterium]